MKKALIAAESLVRAAGDASEPRENSRYTNGVPGTAWHSLFGLRHR
jgi:hypothetical protein